MRTLVVLLSGVSLLAQVSEPRAGVVTGRDGVVREMVGVAGASLPGDTLLTGAIRTAASGDFWVAKLEGVIRTSRGEEFDAPAGDALIGFSSGSAWIYMPSRGFLRLPRSGGGDTAVCPLRDTIVALAGDLTLYIRRDDGLHAVAIRPSDCAVESDTALNLDATLAVALADGTLVVARDSSVVLRDPSGNLQPFDLPDPPEHMTQMAEAKIHVRTATANFVLDVKTRQVYQLPEVAQ